MNKKYYQWIIGVLIVLNLSTLSIIWFGHFNQRNIGKDINEKRMFEKDRNRDPDFLSKELELNKEQSEIINSLRKDHFISSRKIQKLIHSKKRQIIKESFELEVNEFVINNLIEELGELQKELEYTNMEHVIKMKENINKEQIQKFELLFGKMILRADPENRFRKKPLKRERRKPLYQE